MPLCLSYGDEKGVPFGLEERGTLPFPVCCLRKRMGAYEQDQARIPLPLRSDRRAEDHACPHLRMLPIHLQLGTQPEKRLVSGDREIAGLCRSVCDAACSENPAGDGLACRGLFRPLATEPPLPGPRLSQLLRRARQLPHA